MLTAGLLQREGLLCFCCEAKGAQEKWPASGGGAQAGPEGLQSPSAAPALRGWQGPEGLQGPRLEAASLEVWPRQGPGMGWDEERGGKEPGNLRSEQRPRGVLGWGTISGDHQPTPHLPS